MFFKTERLTFFKPLDSKWRETVASCIKELYWRLYSPESDYTDSLTRADLREMFLNVVRSTPPIESGSGEAEPDLGLDVTNEVNLATSLIATLERSGWLEQTVDPTMLLTTYRFTRPGKLFAEAFVTLDKHRVKIRQRNVRNTKNSLHAFYHGLDPYDLVDALEFSERVVLDISDDITYLNELKQDLTHQAIKQTAVQDLLEFMEKHFKPDLSIRLAADSVEKHRDDIRAVVDKIKRLKSERLLAVEPKLSTLLLGTGIRKKSKYLVFDVLLRIERTIDAACEAKLPALRAALNGFIKRSTLITKQQTAMFGGLHNDKVHQAMDKVAKASRQEQEARLCAAWPHLALLNVRLVNPGNMRLRERTERKRATTATVIAPVTRQALIAAAMADAESKAFSLSTEEIKRRLLEQMEHSDRVRLSQLPVQDVDGVLTLINALEAVATRLGRDDHALEVECLSDRFSNPYVTTQDFIIRKKS